ncbi:MAG: valine--tRNA ligase, partial [Gammaproteobacteria bacterium]|nr:valine--tRNA ligase [Gammaproteobacteria bacterium]
RQGGHAGARARRDPPRRPGSRLAGIDAVEWLEAGAEPPPAAVHVVGDLNVLVPLEGLIDVDRERARLEKEIARRSGEFDRVQAKLGNENFLTKAPEAIVAAERDKAADLSTRLDTLRAQFARLESL